MVDGSFEVFAGLHEFEFILEVFNSLHVQQHVFGEFSGSFHLS